MASTYQILIVILQLLLYLEWYIHIRKDDLPKMVNSVQATIILL